MQKSLSLELLLITNNFYIIPNSLCTQALAQDQLRALLAMTKGFDDSLNIGVYDGDTTQEERTWLRHNSRLVFG